MTLPGLPGGEPLRPRPFLLDDALEGLEHADGRPLELEPVQRHLIDAIASNVDAPGGTFDPGDVVAELHRMRAELEAAPPTPRRIRASHAVPRGRVARQWNTRGELELWANLGELEDLPRQSVYGVDVVIGELAPPGVWGIPIHREP